MTAWLGDDYPASSSSLRIVSRLPAVASSEPPPLATTQLALTVVSTSSGLASSSSIASATDVATLSLPVSLGLSSLAASASLPAYSYGAMATATAADQNASIAGYSVLGAVCLVVLVLAVGVGLGLFARAHPDTYVGRGIRTLSRKLCGCCCCYERRDGSNKPKRLEDGLAPALMAAAPGGQAGTLVPQHRDVPTPPAHHHRLGHRRTLSEDARERELAEARVQVQRAQAPLPKRQQTVIARGLTIQPSKPSMRRPSQRPELDDVTEASEPPTAGTRLVESPEPIGGPPMSNLTTIEERRAF